MNTLDIYLDKKNTNLIYYSPYRFLREISTELLIKDTVIDPIKAELENKQIEVVSINLEGREHLFLFKKLTWDSENLGFESFKLIHIFYNHKDFNLLTKAINTFKKQYCIVKNGYYYFDIPGEDVFLTQALNMCGFRLVETRLNYYYENVTSYASKDRYNVKYATSGEAEALRNIAEKMRNPYDRLHADCLIDDTLADNYIGLFAYNAVLGFADFVLTPNIPDEAPIGFLAFNKPVKTCGIEVSKLVLAAIDNTKHKGWLIKLLSETLFVLQKSNTKYLTTITQTSNIAAFRTWENFGFKLGFVTNILVFKND